MEYNLNHLWGRMMSTSKLISQVLPETIEVFHNGMFQHTVDFLFWKYLDLHEHIEPICSLKFKQYTRFEFVF